LDHENRERIWVHRHGYAHKKANRHHYLTVNTYFEVDRKNLRVEAIGRQSPHHALFMNKRVNKQRLAMEYNPPATAATALLGSYPGWNRLGSARKMMLCRLTEYLIDSCRLFDTDCAVAIGYCIQI